MYVWKGMRTKGEHTRFRRQSCLAQVWGTGQGGQGTSSSGISPVGRGQLPKSHHTRVRDLTWSCGSEVTNRESSEWTGKHIEKN